ncbi:kinase-like protein [Rhizophagus irregularis]|uniref:Kinase-like protein n=1 Tax=Rhizophagus irregularis TaxID=588596 RepID=A0A2I1GV42_9GLOM|nr:kinase-like protein [Rhizophagus irregularis]
MNSKENLKSLWKFKDNFKNWTSGNKDIDEFIQQSQLNAVYFSKYLEWIPFENFEDITYITKGGFGKIYSAKWPEGFIYSWNIENQKWNRYRRNIKVALKSLDNSSCKSTEFLNEIKSHLQIYFWIIIQCYGITQDPNTKDYMMVLYYCKNGNLRNYYINNELNYCSKVRNLARIAKGLVNIHNVGKIHKDFHSGNILFDSGPYISDLGMCQPANNEKQSTKQEGIYGVLPYIAPEVFPMKKECPEIVSENVRVSLNMSGKCSSFDLKIVSEGIDYGNWRLVMAPISSILKENRRKTLEIVVCWN